MSKVILYGALAEQFAPEYNLDVRSPKEAVRALSSLVPNFKDVFQEGAYYVYVDDGEHTNIDESNFGMVVSGTIHILPEIVGAKKGGLGKVILGVAMLGLSVFTAGAGAGLAVAAWSSVGLSTSAAITATGLTITALTNVGISLALGGAAQMLSPKPTAQSEAATQTNKLLAMQEGTLSNGAVVPLIYGEYLATGKPVTFEISDVSSVPGLAPDGSQPIVDGWEIVNQALRDIGF